VLAAAAGDVAIAFVELGAIMIGLAILARLSDRVGVSPIPAYLLAGLLFGEGGLAAPQLSADFLELAAEIGVVLLLLTLGLEYSAEELSEGTRAGWPAGLVDLVLNASPGVVAALLLGWSTEAAVLLGGITYISSSGVVAKVLSDLGRLGNRETPAILTVLVIEDLAMAVYLPCVAVMLSGSSLSQGFVSVLVALSMAGLILVAALRFGGHVTRLLHARTDEALLLGLVGTTLLVAGVAQELDVSAAVGAFLVGIALSGPLQQRVTVLVEPLRDLFAALFFILFGFSIDPSSLPGVLAPAVGLAVVTAITKVATGRYAAGRLGVSARGRMRAGTALIARGEFSIVIAGLALGTMVEPDLVALAAAYVLLLAVAGPVVTRFADRLVPSGGAPSTRPADALVRNSPSAGDHVESRTEPAVVPEHGPYP
jgi:CPA2 family monovalent cation:H+ antiporter-2